MLNEPIFCNENIKIDNKVVLYRRWLDKGIFATRHLIERKGNFLSYQAFTHKFYSKINFVSYMGCTQVIKKYTGADHQNLNETDYHDDINKALQIIYSIKKEQDDTMKLNCCDKWEFKLVRNIEWHSFLKSHKLNIES